MLKNTQFFRKTICVCLFVLGLMLTACDNPNITNPDSGDGSTTEGNGSTGGDSNSGDSSENESEGNEGGTPKPEEEDDDDDTGSGYDESIGWGYSSGYDMYHPAGRNTAVGFVKVWYDYDSGEIRYSANSPGAASGSRSTTFKVYNGTSWGSSTTVSIGYTGWSDVTDSNHDNIPYGKLYTFASSSKPASDAKIVIEWSYWQGSNDVPDTNPLVLVGVNGTFDFNVN